MRNVEPCPPSAEPHRPSRPDSVTSGKFPKPSHPLLSGSQGENATRPNNANVPMGTLPPYSIANRRMPVPLLIEFQNCDAQTNSAPTEYPPTYDQTFAPRDANTPNTAAAGTSLDTSLNSPEGLTSTRRTTIIQEGGKRPDVDNKCAGTSCMKGVITFLVVIFIIAVKALVRYVMRL